MHTLNIRVTHHKADVSILELFSFPKVEEALKEIMGIGSIDECVIIQTCNRVEIFAGCKEIDKAYHDLMDYMMSRAVNKIKAKHRGEDLAQRIIENSKRIHDAVEIDSHSSALHHLLRLTSGLESMIIGEDQILGQVKDAFDLAYKTGTVGPFFKNIFRKAINVGKKVRTETGINKGAVSIGSAAVELAEKVLGELKDKKILIIGAGEMATLIAKSLKEREVTSILVANRTYERGVKLAEELGGEVIKFDELADYLAKTDLIISATSAPHVIITKELLEKSIDGDKKLMIIDIAIPRDVSEDVKELSNVNLFNIDSLREIAEENKKKRMLEAIKVEEIIEKELSVLVRRIYTTTVEDIIKHIYQNAENVRVEELEKAIRMLGNEASPREIEIIDDLTKVVVSKTLFPIVKNMREAVEDGNKEKVKIIRELFLKKK